MNTLTDFAATATRWRSWSLMARQDINLRYKRSVLGPFWISIALGVTALGVGLLYSEVFQQEASGYIPFLAISFMTWNFISGMITDGNGIIIEASGHLRSVHIPVPMLAARMTLRNVIILLHHILVVFAIIVMFGSPITWTALLAIPGVLTVGLVGYFLAIVLGPICARYRDVPQTINSVMQLAFLLTPVIWRPEQAAGRSFLVDFNPFYHLIEIIREPLLGERATDMNWIVSLSVLGGVALIAALSLPATRSRVSLWI